VGTIGQLVDHITTIHMKYWTGDAANEFSGYCAALTDAAEADAGERADRPTTDVIEENRRLAKENAELRRANEILGGVRAHVRLRPDPPAATPRRDPRRPQACRAADARAGLAGRALATWLARRLNKA
jgi:hypothetical protein